jgi:hypothetical protein
MTPTQNSQNGRRRTGRCGDVTNARVAMRQT